MTGSPVMGACATHMGGRKTSVFSLPASAPSLPREGWNGFLFGVVVSILVGLNFWILTCSFGVVFDVFADSGQVRGGFVLDGLKTVLDTLRHSSQLPLLRDWRILLNTSSIGI